MAKPIYHISLRGPIFFENLIWTRLGGDLKNRARLLTEIVRTVKGAVGTDFPVWVRINALEYGVEKGRTLEEAKEIARLAQEAGADAIHVSAYGPKAPQHLTMPKPVSGVLADLAHSVKQVVTIPVIAVGRITPEAGERILAEGKADLVAIGKAFLADPEIPAKVAAPRGHRVTLWEKNSSLGGQLNYAAISPYKNGIVPLIKYYQTQMQKFGIKIELGKAATETMIKAFQPEVVVLATGAVPIIPEIGKGKRLNPVTALEVLGGYKEIQERIVVVGGGLIGCEAAEFLAEGYKDIIILEMLEKIGSDIGPTLRPHILERLKAAGIQTEVGIKITEITEKGVRGLRNGSSEFFDAGTIVIAVGMRSESQLAESLKATVPEIHLVGDCINPRRIREAITDGYRVGLKI